MTFKFSELNEPAEMAEDNYRDRKELVHRDQPRALILCLSKNIFFKKPYALAIGRQLPYGKEKTVTPYHFGLHKFNSFI